MNCGSWTAWRDRMPGHRIAVHVTGECIVDAPAVCASLRRPMPPPAGAKPPVVRGPCLVTRAASPPVFEIEPGTNRFYAFELATDAQLLDPANAGRRTRSTFYASWQDQRELLQDTKFQPQADIWRRFSARAELLFYAIATSNRARAWVNPEFSTRRSQWSQAPFLAFVDAPELPNDPELLVLSIVVTRSEAPGTPGPKTIPLRYFEQTDEEFHKLLVLRAGPPAAIEEVF